MDFLVPQDKYLEAGIHIGTRTKNGAMRQFIYKAREDGLHVLDLKKSNERVAAAIELVSKYDLSSVFIVGSKENCHKAVAKFCNLTGARPFTARFTPGMFTNPARVDFCEPKLVLIVDPAVDKQALREAFEINVPVVAFCDTNNSLKYVDLCVPTNNKGRKALALLFLIMAREVLKSQGKITTNEEFTTSIEEFEA